MATGDSDTIPTRVLMRGPATFLLAAFLLALSTAIAYVRNIAAPDRLRWLNIEKDFVGIETLLSSIVSFLAGTGAGAFFNKSRSAKQTWGFYAPGPVDMDAINALNLPGKSIGSLWNDCRYFVSSKQRLTVWLVKYTVPFGIFWVRRGGRRQGLSNCFFLTRFNPLLQL